MDYKIKMVTGFRRDQEHSIDANEAHKAYYLFLNPDQRGVFSNGLAILGSQIQEIIPDFQGTMGWNPTHVLDADDWNELNRKGIAAKIQKYLTLGKDVARFGDTNDLHVGLIELVRGKYPALASTPSNERTGGMKRIGNILS